jgi:hypothetical protein
MQFTNSYMIAMVALLATSVAAVGPDFTFYHGTSNWHTQGIPSTVNSKLTT